MSDAAAVAKICMELTKLSKISVRKEKEELLRTNDGPVLRFFLETLFNPYLTYGVKKISKTVTREVPPTLEVLQDVRDRLATRKVTGHAAIHLLENTVNCSDPLIRACLAGVFVKDLKLGADVKTINKVFPNFLPTFDLGLCDVFEDEKELPEGKWAMEPKYDGLRGVIVINENGESQAYSRNGKEMYNLEYITDELKALGLKSVVLDGEIFGTNWNVSIGIAHTQSDHPDKKELKFHIFDVVPFDNWNSKTNQDPYFVRKYWLKANFENKGLKNIVVAPEIVVETYEHAVLEYRKRLAEGYEGVVLKELNSVYPFDRSKFWLKWKPVQTEDVRIIGYEAGTGKNANRLGAFICDFKGEEVKVGGGYTDELREKFWAEREQMIGKIIETESQETTKDGKLRFPVFIRLRVDKE